MIALLAGLLLAASVSAHAADVPVPPLQARVTDQVGLLSPDQRAQLEQRLAAIEKSKGSQVAILIVPTTQPEPIEDYSMRVAEAWKLGRGKVDGKSVDDGVLILVAAKDRKMRIEVGYGLEGAIPDAIANRIIAETMAPAFRKGDYYGGLSQAVDDVGRLIQGEALPPPWQAAHGQQDGGTNWLAGVFVVLFAGFVATAVLGRVLGSLVGGGAAAAGALLAGASLLVAGLAALGAFALFLAFASTLGSGGVRSAGGTRSGGPWVGGPWIGGPGGWGGGGGDSGGGFSGGGGSFGGGGASGDW